MPRRSVSWLTSAALLIGTAPAPLRAQPVPPPPSPPYQPVPAPMPGLPPGPELPPPVAIYGAEQLDAILAPIALYPDVLLTQILMASAFPLQLVDASRWLQQGGNANLRGEALQRALAGRNWDPSVKSLVPFPQVIAQLTANLEWLQDLGTATVQQQADVMDSIQRLRQLAAAAGNLRSSEQYVVRTEERYIYIEPVQPELIYVPAYNPTVVYGTWAYPAYPPVYLPPPPGYGWGPVLGTALVFGAGVAITAALWNLGRPRWHDRRIHVDVHRYNTVNVHRPPLRRDHWEPHRSSYFHRGGLVDSRGSYVAPSARHAPGPTFRHVGPGGPIAGPRSGPAFGGPGGPRGPAAGPGPGASGAAPGHQFRDRGAPGTVGNSGITPPGHQFRDRGAPGTAGQSGITPPGFQARPQSPPGGSQQYRRPESAPPYQGGGHWQSRRPEGVPSSPPGGGSQYRRPEGGGGAPSSQGGGGGGGGSQQFRSQGDGGRGGGDRGGDRGRGEQRRHRD